MVLAVLVTLTAGLGAATPLRSLDQQNQAVLKQASGSAGPERLAETLDVITSKDESMGMLLNKYAPIIKLSSVMSCSMVFGI
jgi:hypothetical protein